MTVETPEPGVLFTSEGRVWLVIDGDVVDVRHAGDDATSELQPARHVLGEYRTGQPILAGIRKSQGVRFIVGYEHW